MATDKMETSVEVPQKAENRSTTRSNYTTLGPHGQRTGYYSDTCSSMLTAALLIIART